MSATNRRVANRIPLCVPVVTRPSLADCCSLNVSISGIALVSTPTGDDAPAVGALLDVELALPVGDAVRARGKVEWVTRKPGVGGGRGRLTLGVSFVELPPAGRAALVRLSAEYRPRVLVALATPEETE